MKIDLQEFLRRALERLGGWYPAASVLAIQIIAIISAGLFAFFIQQNAELKGVQLQAAAGLSLVLLLVGSLVLAIWTRFGNKALSSQLDDWHRNQRLPVNPSGEMRAWQEVNSLPVRFGFVAFVVTLFGWVAPLAAYLYYAHSITEDQALYVLLGGLASVIGSTALVPLLLDRLMRPVRALLVPQGFESQLAGVLQFRLSAKLAVIASSVILLGLLLMGPIGYHHTLLAAGAGTLGFAESLLSFRVESLVASVIILGMGLGLAFITVRSMTAPTQSMIAALKAVEEGDFSQRVSVSSGDEIGELAVYFNHMVERLASLQGSLETQVKQRTSQLRATVQVANAVSAILDADQLIEQVVNLIGAEFGYYYVALFLNDSSGKWAVLQAATGDAGRVLRANNHRLEIGGRSMVGRAISNHEATVAMDTGEGHIRFENPLLPYTRSEIALPLMVGDRVFGALDAQSTREADFDPETLETLKTLANQVAVALENARLFQNAQQNLEDMKAIQRQYLIGSWKGFAEEKGSLDYEIGETEPGESLSELKIPLSLRDQSIGTIDLAGRKEWTAEERSMIEAIAAQAALALENARLVEESQSSARRERLIAEITGRIWASTTLDGILQTAAKEMGRALDSDEVTIELKAD